MITDADTLLAAYTNADSRTYMIQQLHPSIPAQQTGQLSSGWYSGRTAPAHITVGEAQVCTSATAGCAVTMPAPAAGKSWHIGAVNISDDGGPGGVVMLYDRLAHVRLSTSSAWTNQTVNMVRPAGDPSGHGVHAYLEIWNASGTGASSTLTLSYTNSAGVAGRTATLSSLNPAATASNTFIRFPLQAGDRGVASIQTITTTANWPTHNGYIVLARPVHAIALDSYYGAGASHAFIDIGTPKLRDDACLMTVCSGTGGRFLHGSIRLIQA